MARGCHPRGLARICSVFVTSAIKGVATPPAAMISSTAASACLPFCATISTLAPARANTRDAFADAPAGAGHQNRPTRDRSGLHVSPPRSYSRLLVALVALRPSHRRPVSKITYDGPIHGLAKSQTQGLVLSRATRDVLTCMHRR
jgi:hypothetical protein